MNLKIGDKVWRLDQNRRIYRRDENGRAYGVPIFAEHFHLCEIVGETSRSWIVDGSNPPLKAAKKDPKGIYTDQQKEDVIWEHDNRSKIVRLIERCPLEQLREIARIVGYQPEEK